MFAIGASGSDFRALAKTSTPAPATIGSTATYDWWSRLLLGETLSRLKMNLSQYPAVSAFFIIFLVMIVAISGAIYLDPSTGPLILVGIMFGGGLVLYLALRPKALVIVSLLGVTFSRTIERVIGSSAMTYVDEALIVACLVILVGGRLAQGKMPRGLPGGKSLTAFIAVGLLSSIFAGVSFVLMAQGAFLAAKALLLAWSVAQVNWTPDDLRRGCKALAGVVVLMLFGSFVNLAIPQTWANIFQTLSYVDYRFAGLPSIISLTTHPLDLGGLMLFSAIAIAAYRSQVSKTAMNGWLLLGTIFAGVLTFRRAILGAMVATLGVEKIRERGIVAFVGGLLIIPIAATFLWDAIIKLANSAYVDYVENADKAARTILSFDSFEVAAGYFPFGAGFARYGSFLAAINYSPEYVERGYQSIYGMGPVPNGRFLTDTQWPAIIGETGYVGTGFFVVGMLLIAKHLWHLRRCEEPMHRWVGVTGLGLIGAVGIMSATAPVFTSSTFIGPVFCLIGVAATIPRPAQVGRQQKMNLPAHYQRISPRLIPPHPKRQGSELSSFQHRPGSKDPAQRAR